jgi:hypothetical protein
MKCVSYDYGFEVDLATRWQEFNKNHEAKPNRQKARKGQAFTSPDSDDWDEDDSTTSRSRAHLFRGAKFLNSSLPRGDVVSVSSSSVELSEDEEYLLPLQVSS